MPSSPLTLASLTATLARLDQEIRTERAARAAAERALQHLHRRLQRLEEHASVSAAPPPLPENAQLERMQRDVERVTAHIEQELQRISG